VYFVVNIMQSLNKSVSAHRMLSCVSTRGSYEASAIHGQPYLRAMDLGKVHWVWPDTTVTPLLEFVSVKKWNYPCPEVPCHEGVQGGIQMNPMRYFH
jgi:hypothetical protein